MNVESRGEPQNVVVMAVGNTITTSANSLWIMFMPYFYEDVGITAFFIGIIFTGLAVSRATASFFGGRFADSYGRKPVITIGYCNYILGALVIFVSTSAVSSNLAMAVLLAVIGYLWMMVGSGLQRPASSMLLVESSPEKRRGLSYMFTTRFLPSIPPAFLILIGTSLYINNQFWLGISIGILCLLVVLGIFIFGLKETLAEREIISHDIEDREKLAHPRFDGFILLLIAAFALDGMSSSGLSWYVPIFVGQSNVEVYGVMISVSTLVIAVSALISGGLVDRIGTRAAIFGAWSLLAITVTLFPFGSSLFEIILLYSIWAGLDMVDMSVPPLAVAERYPKEKRATIMGTFSMSVSLLSMVGPALISLGLLLGGNVPFYMKAMMNAVGVIIFLIATRAEES